MAYTLNTSHALYANLVELIGVQSGALVSHKTARTFTTASGSSFGTGTYGEHFHSLENAYSPKGATFTPAIAVNTSSNPNTTVFVVINSAANGVTGNGHLITGIAGPSIGINDTSIVASRGVSDAQSGFTADATTGTAHSVVLTRTGDTAHQVYLDKVSVGTGAGLGYNSSAAELSMLCGASGFSSITCDLVWVAVFNKVLSGAEISDLHDSLGADNAFGLVDSGGGAVTHETSGSLATSSATISGSSARSASFVTHAASGALSAGSATLAGSATYVAIHAASGTLQAGTATVSGSVARSSAGTATLSTPPLKNNTGTVLANLSGWTVNVYNVSTGALIVQKTGLSTDASGVLTITDAALSASTTYSYEPVHVTYGRRLPVAVAA